MFIFHLFHQWKILKALILNFLSFHATTADFSLNSTYKWFYNSKVFYALQDHNTLHDVITQVSELCIFAEKVS